MKTESSKRDKKSQCEFCQRKPKYFTVVSDKTAFYAGASYGTDKPSFRCAYHKNSNRRRYEVVYNGFKPVSEYVEEEE